MYGTGSKIRQASRKCSLEMAIPRIHLEAFRGFKLGMKGILPSMNLMQGGL